MLSSGFLGQLNSKVSACHYFESGCIAPPLDAPEQFIYAELYKYGYFLKLSTQILPTDGSSRSTWTSISEGDSKISRSSISAISANYRGIAKDINDNITRVADLYKRDRSLAESIDYILIEQNGLPNHNALNSAYGGYRSTY